MVIKGDFKVELVEATTKQPFPEHHHEKEDYVEVEPETEYYVSYQRIGIKIKQPFLVFAYVDGRFLGWQDNFLGKPQIASEPSYGGMWRTVKRSGRVTTEEFSLKFARPSLKKKKHGSDRVLMGKVQLSLFKDDGEDSDSELEVAGSGKFQKNVVSSAAAAVKAKSVRSTKGSSAEELDPRMLGHRPGAHIMTITLHYCTVPGLIEVGVLPRPPDNYERHRLTTGKRAAALPPLLVEPKRVTIERTRDLNGPSETTEIQYLDFFDMTEGLDDDSDDVSQNHRREIDLVNRVSI